MSKKIDKLAKNHWRTKYSECVNYEWVEKEEENCDEWPFHMFDANGRSSNSLSEAYFEDLSLVDSWASDFLRIHNTLITYVQYNLD